MRTIDKAPVIRGYDLEAEKNRYDFVNVAVDGKTLNRGTASVAVSGDMTPASHERTVADHSNALFLSTLSDGAPVIELDYPAVGPYVMCSAGTYMDLELGCAQKLLCERHPELVKATSRIIESGLLTRREINSDDYLMFAGENKGSYLPQELASLVNSAVAAAFPRDGGYKTFLSNSGTEATEAGLKLASLVRFRQFEEKFGSDVFARVCADLGIDEIGYLNDNTLSEPLYRTYPMFIIGCAGAFHGRTMGALMGTMSKGAHHIGFPKSPFYCHITFNGDPGELTALLDTRPITEILDAPGGVRGVVEQGRVPVDLAAVFIAEPFQGEGGYKPGDPAFFSGVAKILSQHGIPFMTDEVQAFARTGKLFCTEHLGVKPDIIGMAKGAFVGLTIGPAEWEKYLHAGWHSNTWGGGKVFDTHMAAATFDLLAHYKDPVLDGMTYMENETVKGEYLSSLLSGLRDRHAGKLLDFGGLGLMQSLLVADRPAFMATAWKMGLKFLDAGLGDGDKGKVRLLMLADTLTREVEDLVRALDEVFEAMD